MSGHVDALDIVSASAASLGALRVSRLAVSGAFHTRLMAPARAALMEVSSQPAGWGGVQACSASTGRAACAGGILCVIGVCPQQHILPARPTILFMGGGCRPCICLHHANRLLSESVCDVAILSIGLVLALRRQ